MCVLVTNLNKEIFTKYDRYFIVTKVLTWKLFFSLFLFIIWDLLVEGVKRFCISSGFDIELEVSSSILYYIVLFLKNHSLCQFKILIDIVAYDSLKCKRFFLVYNFLSTHFNLRLRLITKVESEVISLQSLFLSAVWLEREVFDFFGIFFLRNFDLRRILLDYGFSGFPLRKDFPLVGFLEVYYDENQNRICYRPVAIKQKYKCFKFKSRWVV